MSIARSSRRDRLALKRAEGVGVAALIFNDHKGEWRKGEEKQK
jgi:hypothetical protein